MIKGEDMTPSNFLVDVVGAPEGEWYNENEISLNREQWNIAAKFGAVFVWIDSLFVDISVFERIKNE